MPEKLTGLIAASHTPMRVDGVIAYEQIERQMRLYRGNPINGAFICGTTGEGKLLTPNERQRIAECWVDTSGGELPIIVHVGCDCFEESTALARHAQDIGAYAIAATAPSFYRPTCVRDLVESCAVVASAAPRLPFYFYHIPGLTYVDLPMRDFLYSAALRIPNLAGIKYTHDDFADLFETLQFDNGRYNILFGRDELLLAALSFGIDGAVGSTFNYAAPLFDQLIQAHQTGDFSRACQLQHHVLTLVRLLQHYNEIAVGKVIMNALGIECGPVRAPLKNLTQDEWRFIEHTLINNEFSPYLCQSDCTSV